MIFFMVTTSCVQFTQVTVASRGVTSAVASGHDGALADLSAQDVLAGVGDICGTLDGAAVDLHNLLHHGLLDNLDGLHDMLHVLNLLDHLVGDLHLADDLADDDLLHRVRALHMDDLLNGDGHVLDLLDAVRLYFSTLFH